MRRRALPTVAIGMLAASVPAGAQQAASRRLAFAAAVEVVRLDVSVLRDDGRFVTDLGESDIEVLEDGVRQVPSSFARRELPVSLVLMLDASSSIGDRLVLAKAAAAGFLATLRPHDDASVVEFNDRVRRLQAPTPDRAALAASLGQVAAGGSTALYNALYVTLRGLPRPDQAAELRRQAIVLLSDGEDTASLVWEEQVVELARRRAAAIHVIDLRPRDEANRSARLLAALSRESGGELHRPGSIRDLDSVYARIAEELRSQYTIGYVSKNTAQDGRWRRIEVRVRDGLRVRHRTGYYAVP